MVFTKEIITHDLKTMSAKDFYKKYIVKSDNWYFRNILVVDDNEVIDIIDEFKDIVSENLNISFNSVLMVGSGKIGYSLSPKKLLKPFSVDEKSKNSSDIDIAIISNDIFEYFWKLYRKAYNVKYEYHYKHISREIYRGYINEKNLNNIDICRKEWTAISSKCNKSLRSNLYLRHEITYRIYRRWEDFEEYNLECINGVMEGVQNDGI